MAISTFIPTLWSTSLLMHLDNAHVAKTFFNRDYEGEIRDRGDTVRINQIGSVNIITYTRNNDLPIPDELGMVAQDLVIDQADAFNWQIDDVDKVQANADMMNAAMERSAYALADKLDRWLFFKLASEAGNTIGTASSPIIVTPDNVYDLIVQIRTAMSKNNVPTAGRNVAIPPEMVGMILKDTRFTGTGGTMAESNLLSGQIARGTGFTFYEVNTLPESGGVYQIVANNNLSATYASQVVKTEAYRMERRFADGVKGLSVYGAKVTIPQAIVTAYVTFDSATTPPPPVEP